MASFTISVIHGDGIGPEVCAEGVKALEAVGRRCGHSFRFTEFLAGGAAIDACGVPLPDDAVKGVKDSHALLFGAIGGPKWEGMPHHLKPEAGLLKLRRELGAFANLRPAVVFDELIDASSIKPAVLKGTDIMVVRELTGGIYFGPGGITGDGAHRVGINTEVYSTAEIERIAVVAFDCARARGRKLCSVDKANVLVSSQLWREVITALGKATYPDVALSHMYVDNCAMQLIRDPRQFDVIVTTNLFGDILSDEASQLTGSIGMLASASLGGRVGFFEPIHGSAPDIASQQKANPLATIGTVALLLKYGLKLDAEAALVDKAIRAVLAAGLRTADIRQEGCRLLNTREMGAAVVERILAA